MVEAWGLRGPDAVRALPLRALAVLCLAVPVAGAVPAAASSYAADGERILRVGPDRALATPSAAAAVAKDGDTVLIDPGTYSGDVATWAQDDLTLRGDGGRVHLRADGQDAQGKAIWVIAGDRTTVDRIEFSGAAVADRNGAGIRQEGTGLAVTRSWFHDNETGILTGAAGGSRAHLRTNLLVGPGDLTADGSADARANRRVGVGGFVDPDADDFHLLPSSPAIDRGVAVPPRWRARWEYASPARVTRRTVVGRIDLGAHELR